MARVPNDGAEAIQKWEVQLRKGCLELAVLATLWPGRLYGLEILRRLATDSSLLVPEGTIYPLLSRLKHEGWVESEWVASQAGHPRKYFSITPSGRSHAHRMAQGWSSLAASLSGLLEPLRKAGTDASH